MVLISVRHFPAGEEGPRRGMERGSLRHRQLIKKTLGAETAMVQATSPADFGDAMRDVASRGFGVVFAHRFEDTDSALKVGKLSPRRFSS
jgi:hypothetical protein